MAHDFDFRVHQKRANENPGVNAGKGLKCWCLVPARHVFLFRAEPEKGYVKVPINRKEKRL